MATTKEQPAKAAAVLDVPVAFGGVSVGDETARIGVTVLRQRLNVDAAEGVFCGRRLTGRILLCEGDPDQQSFLADADCEVAGVFDCKTFRVGPKEIGAGLTFSLADIDVGDLAGFAKRSGRLLVEGVADLPDEEPKKAKAMDGQKNLLAGGPWRDFPISHLQLAEGITKSLTEAGIETVGAMADYSSGGKALTDIKGIGPGKAEQIENRMTEFWKQNPEDERDDRDEAEEDEEEEGDQE